ncbi:MAG: hypothetical protein Kow00120_08210 [Anaerolineae bacterium]
MSEERPIQQTREQARAKQAWRDVEGVGEDQTKYGTLARKLPALIQTNGLGQTLAFLKSKKKESATQLLYRHLSSWVMQQMHANGDLLQAITGWTTEKYRRATTEALAYALWLRRFAEAQGWGGEEED